eukprot:CAMPEP_0168758710 /NCGR_PEP_ID=MMETSP0724-20121128/21843_1 /TAXON_ID=265536 /ORGANISM="Amphiprora sp., Strain CCMP467" /LENGTH=43 /DNA_ID= /DNA_START= /DNA_END= /DNA_ORIENTATION=
MVEMTSVPAGATPITPNMGEATNEIGAIFGGTRQSKDNEDEFG